MVRTLSLCMIVKNEEKNLPRCLQSYGGLPDEIIVVDTGSTDGTVAIAERFGAKVTRTTWDHDFSRARNLSLEKATSDWILWTDADDLIDPANAEKIRRILDGYTPSAAFSFMIKNSQDGVLGDVFNQVRLFPRHPKIRFRYRVHEQVLPSIQELGLETLYTDIMVIHTGYDGPEAVKAKQRRNLPILEREIRERPDNPVVIYTYAGALNDLGDYAKAADYYEKAMAVALRSGTERHIADGVPVALAGLYGRTKDWPRARKWAEAAYKTDPRHPQVNAMLGELAEMDGKTDDAVRYFESVLAAMEKPTFLPVDVNMLKISACTHLAGLYHKKGMMEKMVELLDKALEIRLGRKVLPSDRGNRLLEAGEHLKAGQEYLAAVNDPASDDWASFLGLAKIFILDNSASDAVNTLEAGLARFPGHEELLMLLADLYDDLKLRDKSVPLYRKILGLSKDPARLKHAKEKCP